MTGNTKVWRAPLAGLASLAMVATMGVAAATANAAPVKVTYNAGDGNFGNNTKTVDDTTTGKVTQSGTVAGKALKAPTGKTFTGWYTQSGEKVNPTQDLTADTTVYAHYAVTKGGLWKVKFQTADSADANNIIASTAAAADNSDNDGDAFTTTVSRTDKLASWQVPTNNRANVDHKVASGWVADANKSQSVEPTGDLTPAAVMVEGVAQDGITLDANLKAANVVTFSATDQFTYNNNAKKNYTVEDVKGAAYDGTSTVTVDVATGETLSAYGELPVVTVNGTNPKQYVNTWATAKQEAGKQVPDQAFAAATKVTSDVTVYPNEAKGAYTVTLHYADNTTKAVLVNDGATLAKPEIPAKSASENYEYEAAGWYTSATGTKAFDFSKPFDTHNHPADLYALYKVSAVKLTFSYGSYADAPKDQKVSFKNGDTLTAPKFTRDGYELAGFNGNAGSEVFPENAVLVLDSVAAQDPKTVTTSYKTSDGTEQGVNNTKFTSTTFTANWTNDAEAPKTIKALEGRVVVLNSKKNYIQGKDQKDFTAASYDQYVKDFQAYLKNKEAAKDGGYTVAEYASLIKELQTIQSKLVEKAGTPLYRAYNPGNGDHYFTSEAKAQSYLVKLGWKAEGAPYKVVNKRSLPDSSEDFYKAVDAGHVANYNFGTAVFSVYNPNTGEHLLTSEAEADFLDSVGWNKEQIQFYTVQNGSAEVVRVYNPNTTGPAHLYTNAGEAQGLAKIGWRLDYDGKPVFTLGK